MKSSNPANKITKFKCNQCSTVISVEGYSPNYCGNCCALSPSYKNIITEFLKRSRLAKELDDSSRQYLKGEYVSAVRTATIVVENEIKRTIGDDTLFGMDLMSKALSFTFDEQKKAITKEPLIKLNSLLSKTERNEQDGLRFLCMGIMTGCRNIFAHSNGHADPSDCLSIIMMCNFVIKQLKYGTLTASLIKKVASK